MDLRTARFFKNKTQSDLTLKTGIHQSKISLIERGYMEPSKDEIKRLAKALGIKAKELSWDNNTQKSAMEVFD